MNSVPVVADRVVHVLDQVAAERNVDDLSAAADRQQRQVVTECDARDGKIECILLLIDPVLGRMRLLARPRAATSPPPGSSTPSANQIRSRAASTSIGRSGAYGCTTTGSPPAANTASTRARAVTSAS